VKRKYDNLILGLIVGVVVPIITYFLVLNYIYPFQFADQSLHSLWIHLMAPKMISIGVIPNLAFFFLFVYTNRLKSGRGVLMATIFYAIVVLIMKVVW
jgi:hypothetical protein